MSIRDAQRRFHDEGFPPKRSDESAHEFLKRALMEHQETHAKWRDYHQACGDEAQAAYQQRAVERYDEMLFSLAALMR